MLQEPSIRPILRFFGHDPSDPASRIITITFVTRDKVNMDMRHSLTCGGTVVDTDIVRSWSVLGVQHLLGRFEQCHECLPLFGAEIEKRTHMPFGDHQRMSLGNRKIIPKHDAKIIAIDNARWIEIAEETIHLCCALKGAEANVDHYSLFHILFDTANN